MRCRRCLHVVLRRRRHTRDTQELVIDLVDCSRADDELQLPVRLKHALDALDIVEVGLVDFAVILDNEPKPRCAVRRLCDIVPPTDVVDDFLCALPVIQRHKPSPFSETLPRQAGALAVSFVSAFGRKLREMIAHAHDTYGTLIPHIHLYPTPVSFEQCDQRPLFYSYNNRSYNKFSFSKAR